MSIFITPLRSTTFNKSSKAVDKQEHVDEESPVPEDESRETSYVEDAEDALDEDEDEHDLPREETSRQSGRSAQAGKHRSLRYQHIDVVVTLVHKSILEADWARAERAYGLLLRCKGIDVRLCYDLGLEILNHTDPTGGKAAEFLKRLIIAYPPLRTRQGKRNFDRADKFVPMLVEHWIWHKQFKVAVQELDRWLLVPPYKDDVQLWKYLAALCEDLHAVAEVDGNEQEAESLQRKRERALAKVHGDGGTDIDDI